MKKSGFLDTLAEDEPEVTGSDEMFFEDDAIAPETVGKKEKKVEKATLEPDPRSAEAMDQLFDMEEEEDEDDQEEEDQDEEEEESEEKPKSKKAKEEEEPKEEEEKEIEIPAWAKKVKDLYPDEKLESIDDFDRVIETHINKLEETIENQNSIQAKWGELAIAYPGLDKFIESLEMGESPTVAALKMGISPEDFEVYDESELDVEKKILLKHENKKNKEARIQAQKEMKQNIEKANELIESVSKELDLDEKESDQLTGAINDFIQEAITKGKLNPKIVREIAKGIVLDKVVKKETSHAFIQGRNERFKVEKKKKEGDGLPGLKSASTTTNRPPVDTDKDLEDMDRYVSGRTTSWINKF